MSEQDKPNNVIGMMERKEKQYLVQTRCMNCDHDYLVHCPVGTMVAEKNQPCPKCGCTPRQVQSYWEAQRATNVGPR